MRMYVCIVFVFSVLFLLFNPSSDTFWNWNRVLQKSLLRFQSYIWIWPPHMYQVFIVCLLFLCFSYFSSFPCLALVSKFSFLFLRCRSISSPLFDLLSCTPLIAYAANLPMLLLLAFVLSSQILLRKSQFYRAFLISSLSVTQMVPKVPDCVSPLQMEQCLHF